MVEREERGGGRRVDGDNALVNGIQGVMIYTGMYTLNDVYVMIREPIEWKHSGS
jgi:hypothetical protein